jgi:hypothetical protein
VALGACGSDSTSSSTSAATASSESKATSGGATSTGASSGSGTPSDTASAEVCAAREDLRSSISELKDVDVIANGTSALQTPLNKVEDNLTALKSAAGDELKPQVTAFQDAVDALETAVKDVGSGGVSAVATAAKDVATSGSDLLTSLDDLRC